MKYLKEDNKKPKLPLIIILLVCLAVAGVGAWFFVPQNAATAIQIKTPYGEVTLEGAWVPALRYSVIQGDITELKFSSEIAGTNVKLFDLYLGSEEHLAGYLTTDSGERAPVSIVVYDIVPAESWSEEEEEQAFAMQDALNEILAQLSMEAAFMDVEESGTEVTVQTSFGVLTYKDAWNGALRIIEENGCISGFGTLPGKPEQALFEISIGGEGELLAGMYTDRNGREIPVFLTVPNPAFDTEWTEQQRRDIYGMQNVLNDILEQLDLTAAEQATETEPVLEDVYITTPYGTIAYPGEYNGKLRIAQENSNGYRLSAFAAIPGKTEVQLFDILIGGSGEVYAGTLKDSSGISKEVYLNVPELNLEDGWTEEEHDDVYGMQFLVNDFCEQFAVTVEQEEKIDEVTVGSDVVVQMPYGSLRYPGEYRQYLATEVTRDNGRTVIFYARRNSGEKIRLFDLIFGGTGEAYVGQITAGDGTILDVYVTSYELSTDDSWSDEETQTIYEMQEAVNYVLQKMEENGTLMY